MRPSRALPPELYWPGTRPSHALNVRPQQQSWPLPIVLTGSMAVVWPMPDNCINCCKFGPYAATVWMFRLCWSMRSSKRSTPSHCEWADARLRFPSWHLVAETRQCAANSGRGRPFHSLVVIGKFHAS